MATQVTVWRPFADFGELRQRVDEVATKSEGS